ncbi:MAG: proteasome subunit alpha [Acidimicrobiales bacterium]|nr:proteasome subunit alpha [Acidimicrobiales bacterium]
MSMPFYVAPEQVMKDRADYARKGIARGRSLVAGVSADGIVLVAENPSATLRKISEIYDRIAFAGVGRYNEFDQLRVAGVRHADLKGYSYSREDVDARSLANAYAQALGQVFTHEMKPLEVEILVAEVGPDAADDQLFHILYDGTVIDEPLRAVLGGDAEALGERFEADHDPAADAATVLRVAIRALAGPDRTLSAGEIEAAMLERNGDRRTFRRLTDDEIAAAIDPTDGASDDADSADPADAPQADSDSADDSEDPATGPEVAGDPADVVDAVLEEPDGDAAGGDGEPAG